jgi:hypothetical protein
MLFIADDDSLYKSGFGTTHFVLEQYPHLGSNEDEFLFDAFTGNISIL